MREGCIGVAHNDVGAALQVGVSHAQNHAVVGPVDAVSGRQNELKMDEVIYFRIPQHKLYL